MSDLSLALLEELTKAVRDAPKPSFDPFTGDMEDASVDDFAAALAPILSRALTEAAEKMRDQAIVAVDAESLEDETGEPEDVAYQSAINDSIRAIRAIPNPYLTEKEQSQ